MNSSHRVRLTNPLTKSQDLRGKRAVVTGGAGGLGLVTVRALAVRGATVVIGARNTAGGERARARLLAEHELPEDRIHVAPLDLIDPESVARFAGEAGAAPVDALVLNAGISSVPLSHDHNGIESQFATNHLGHFALTGLLIPALNASPSARVVTVSSNLYSSATLNLDDLSDATGYSPGRAYSRSKFANVIFGIELDRRLRASGSAVRSYVAHPGMARTPLHATYPTAAMRVLTSVAARLIGRDPEPADVGVLTAVLSSDATPDLMWGPVGSKKRPDALGAPFTPEAIDEGIGAQLWATSERWTGVTYL
jgi:NAD(P)-dependent dehydrogenase (short-subunit alcohol dehydrogenase family)